MTLVELAVILAVLVAGAVFAVWTVSVHTVRCGRLIQLHRQRMAADIAGLGEDRLSRAWWGSRRHSEYERAMAITLERRKLALVEFTSDVERLHERLVIAEARA